MKIDNGTYVLEFLVLFHRDMVTTDQLSDVLSQPDDYWTNKKVSEEEKDGRCMLRIDDVVDRDLIRIVPFDPGFKGGDVSTSMEQMRAAKAVSGWIIEAGHRQIDKAEYLRYFIATALRARLDVVKLHLLRDQVSEFISAKIYPSLFRVETDIRRFLTRFFVPIAGSDWLQHTATSTSLSRADKRRHDLTKYHDWKWSGLLDDHLTFFDFHEIGQIITKRHLGINEPEQILDRIELIDDLESFRQLKEEMVANYSRFFRDTFKDNAFHLHWRQLGEIRNRIAHSGLLRLADVSAVERLVGLIGTILADAESSKVHLDILAESEALNVATDVQESSEEEPNSVDYSDLLPRLTFLGKIDLTKVEGYTTPRRGISDSTEDEAYSSSNNEVAENDEASWIIEPEEILDALQEYLSDDRYRDSKFLALSTFINQLEEEGYDRHSVRRVAYEMAAKEDAQVEIYPYESSTVWQPVTSIRLSQRVP